MGGLALEGGDGRSALGGRGVCMEGQTPPPRPLPSDTVNQRSVRILLECILVLLWRH